MSETSSELGWLRQRVAQLERSLAQTQELVRNAPVLVASLTLDGSITTSNRMDLAAAGRPIWEAAWWRDDPAAEALLRAGVERAAGGDPFEGELAYRSGAREGWVALTLRKSLDGARLLLTGEESTDRRRAGEQLRALEQLAPRLMWVSDERGVILDVSAPLRDYVGEFEALNWVARVHPEDREAWSAAREGSRSSAGPWQLELRLRSSAGGYRWFLCRAIPLRVRSEGPVERWLGVLVDIEDRKRATHEALERSALLEAIIHASPEPIYVRDRQGRLTHATEAAMRAPAPGLQSDEALMATGLARTEEEELQLADGTTRVYLETRHPHRDEHGEVVGLIGFRRDITALRRSQQQVNEILERISDAFCALDRDFTVERVNAQHERLTRIGHEAQLGKNFLELFLRMPDAERSTWWRELHRAMRERVPVTFEAFHEPLKSWIRTNIHPHPDGGLTIYFKDLSEQRQSEAQAQAAVAARDAFLGAASHELRSPLNALLMQAQLDHRLFEKAGAKAFDAERLRKQIATALAQTSRLSQLVDELLDAHRLATGRMLLRLQSVDLSALVTSAVEPFGPLLATAGCELSLDLEPRVTVRADAYRLEQVIAKLLSNAVKYAPGAPVTISLRGALGGATLLVRDRGEGIPGERLETLFTRFAGPRSLTGLGFGLSVAKEIVEAHGGAISVSSPPGSGAQFTISLPAALQTASSSATTAAASEPREGQPFPSR